MSARKRKAMAAGRLALDWWHVLPLPYLQWKHHEHISDYVCPVLRDGAVHMRRSLTGDYGPETIAMHVPWQWAESDTLALAWLTWQGVVSPVGWYNIDLGKHMGWGTNLDADGVFARLAADHDTDPRNLRDMFERGAL